MLDLISNILHRECPFLPEKPVLLGVSGGPDSLCLLDILHRQGFPLVVAHLNHGLRPEAAEEARRVQEMARSRQLPYVSDEVDTRAYADKEGFSVEEAARELRYGFLFAHAQQAGAQAVAVAHTADDQVETVLMHLLRGAGLEGLRGMLYWSLPNPWSEVIPLARPLLGVWREQVITYCQQQGLQPVQDLSNLDTTYFRNRLRHELIPILEQYNPRLRQNMANMAYLLAGDFSVLEQQVAQAWQMCWMERGEGWLVLDLEKLRALEKALQRRVLRQAIAYHRPGLRDIESQMIARALDFLAEPSRSGICELAAGLHLQIEGQRLWVAEWGTSLPGSAWPALPDGAPQWLNVPGRLRLGDGWELHAELCETAWIAATWNHDRYQVWLKADAAPAPLLVRARQAGERYAPAGMRGHTVKISDEMINYKIPRRARNTWPLVCAGEQVVWLPGCRQAASTSMRPATKHALHLRLLRETPPAG